MGIELRGGEITPHIYAAREGNAGVQDQGLFSCSLHPMTEVKEGRSSVHDGEDEGAMQQSKQQEQVRV